MSGEVFGYMGKSRFPTMAEGNYFLARFPEKTGGPKDQMAM